jgi:hypothetical protein
MAARKKWSTTTVPTVPRKTHPSQPAAYRQVQELAALYAKGSLRPDLRRVQVWVDEGDGQGWRLHETLDLAELAHMQDGA